MIPCYSNHAVSGQIDWPHKFAKFEFGPHEIIAYPGSKDHDASLHIDINRSQVSWVQGMSILNQLLSIAVWLDDEYAVLHDGGSGSAAPSRPSRRSNNYPTSTLDIWCNSWRPINNDVVRRSLAIYREAINMYHFHSIPFAVLGFYKILETTFDGDKRKRFLVSELDKIMSKGEIDEYQLREIGLGTSPSSHELARFLQQGGRHAVAHAAKEPTIDPDDIRQVRAMSVAASILRLLARQFIVSELNVSTERWDQKICAG